MMDDEDSLIDIEIKRRFYLAASASFLAFLCCLIILVIAMGIKTIN